MELNHQNLAKVIEDHQLLDPAKKVLIGVSAGIDSMVLAHLLLELGYVVEIVHCNFKLRGEESDGDEEFVKEFSLKRGLKVHTRYFDTKAYSEDKKLSTQVAARELRYQWFHILLEKRNIQSFALGHHADDNFETALFHLIKGGGWRQNLGIPIKNGPFVRPMLFFSKSEITKYARTQKISWREDLSNEQNEYLRNKLRHEIVPQIRKINPHPEQTFKRTYLRNKEIEKVLNQHLKEFQIGDLDISIDIEANKSLPGFILKIEDILAEYGYSGNQIEELRKFLNSKTGARMLLPLAELYIDRGKLIITSKITKPKDLIQIDGEKGKVNLENGIWEWSSEKKLKKTSLSSGPWTESFDLAKLKFPLEMRPWQKGDWFKPLGLKGKKKISDFLVDQKVPLSEKDKIQVLKSGENIIWVVGYRMDDRFKVTSTTKRIFKLWYSRP